MNFKSLYILVALALSSSISFASETKSTDTTKQYEIAADDQVLSMIDSAMANSFFNHYRIDALDSTFILANQIPADSILPLYDSILEVRLNKMNAATPIEMEYNQYVKAFINLYVNKKTRFKFYCFRHCSALFSHV